MHKKIITLTLSPAVDIEYHVPAINTDGLNRTSDFAVSAGGKGINVSRAIRNCLRKRIALPNDVELVTVAPIGGHVGDMLKNILEDEFLPLSFVKIDKNTRANVSLISADESHDIEINAPGTPIGDKLCEIERMVLDGIGENDVVVIAGSCPSDVSKAYPAQLCAKVKAKGAVCVLDCDGEALKLAVTSDVPPDLIKPNRDELAALTERSLETMQDVAQAAESLAVPTVITTMAGDGAIITREINDYRASTLIPTEKRPTVRLKGAGDTFLGAFVYARYAAEMGDVEAMNFANTVAGDYVESKF